MGTIAQCKSQYAVANMPTQRLNVRIHAATIRNLSSILDNVIAAELAANDLGVMLTIFSERRGRIYAIVCEPSDLSAQPIKNVQSNA
jgi:hypothetical protein